MQLQENYNRKEQEIKPKNGGGFRSVMVNTLKQEVQGSNPCAAPPKFGAHTPSLLTRLQVAKMCQGSLKGMVYAKAEHPG